MLYFLFLSPDHSGLYAVPRHYVCVYFVQFSFSSIKRLISLFEIDLCSQLFTLNISVAF
jgi:hypothetical protein